MKKKLPLAKEPLPKFRSDKEAAEYFEEHSVAQFWDRLPEANQPSRLRLYPNPFGNATRLQNRLFRFAWFRNRSRRLSPSATRLNYACGSLRGSAATASGGDTVAQSPRPLALILDRPAAAPSALALRDSMDRLGQLLPRHVKLIATLQPSPILARTKPLPRQPPTASSRPRLAHPTLP
jgi:hypothetical protein